MKYARPQFAVGFSFDQESYGKLSEQLSGIGVDFLDVIGLNLEVICRNVVTVRSLETVPYIANNNNNNNNGNFICVFKCAMVNLAMYRQFTNAA